MHGLAFCRGSSGQGTHHARDMVRAPPHPRGGRGGRGAHPARHPVRALPAPGVGAGWGAKDHYPLKSLSDFLALAATDIEMLENGTLLEKYH